MEEEIRKRIRELREAKGVKQEDLATSLEISLFSYSKLERGKTQLTINYIERIAKALGVDPYYIISGNEANADIEALRKENEALKKDIERYKGIVDTYQDKIEIADGVINFLNHFKEMVSKKDNPNKEETEKRRKEAAELLKDFKL